MALTFCWEVEDVVHFKLNSMATSGSPGTKSDLTQGKAQIQIKLYKLYRYTGRL